MAHRSIAVCEIVGLSTDTKPIEEYWTLHSINSYGIANLWTRLPAKFRNQGVGLSTHLTLQTTLITDTETEGFYLTSSNVLYIRINTTRVSTVTDFKAYLSAQYAAGTPVTVWYVLATEETGIVNEPLMKIGEYADTVSGISIPTIAGANTISVGTTVQPSEVTVNYKGWHPVADVHERDNGAWT